MKKRNLTAAVSLALIVVIALIIILQWRASIDTPSISIPSPSVDMGDNGIKSGNTPLVADVDNVQELIASLERPDSYSRRYLIRTYWDGGGVEAQLTVYRKDERCLIIHEQNGIVKNTLFAGGKIHFWNDSEAAVTSANIKDVDLNTLDLYARLVFYEELLDVSKEDILDAADEVFQNESCIYVEYRHSERYVYRLHISVEKGMLVGAQVLEDGKTVYTLDSEAADFSAPEDDMFILPR